MSAPRRLGWRAWRHIAVPALAVAVVATLPMTPGRDSGGAADRWTPMTPVAVTYGSAPADGQTVQGNLLGFNDFHGNIDPPTGSGGLVNGNPAGGVEYL